MPGAPGLYRCARSSSPPPPPSPPLAVPETMQSARKQRNKHRRDKGRPFESVICPGAPLFYARHRPEYPASLPTVESRPFPPLPNSVRPPGLPGVHLSFERSPQKPSRERGIYARERAIPSFDETLPRVLHTALTIIAVGRDERSTRAETFGAKD